MRDVSLRSCALSTADLPGLAGLPQAGGDLCCHITEKNPIFDPSDTGIGKGVDICPEFPNFIQLCRFVLPELRIN